MDQSVSQIMTIWPQTIAVFLRHRMHCVGCHVARFHTISDVCAVYRLDEDAFRDELQCAINASPQARPE
ncbi:MAG: DUF1858 domain-containing protein [Rhodobacterales bacterium]|nr:DUF1858 domain-containing protein [Rhodobacterales bacterium]